MSSSAEFYPACDNDWIKAVGLDPNTYPEYETVDHFLNSLPLSNMKQVREACEKYGFALITRHFTLTERFKLYGLEIVRIKYEEPYMLHDYKPKTITLSNGVVLKEVRDENKERELYKELDPNNYGNLFIFAYKVIKE